ncbi:phosphoadenylyl-sulfate reductase [Ponticaulis sp.]|uniref:phosphoadenylyl-sulfate reductase n=1 Tax=Ponticaulis sp. TaxID=2020902 RepID=UPI000B68B1EE|nr:phosphoadenylyl-sulfate reductase [Ponticaulis sp.]MAI91977.1 phosphoadenylyl-sulfate reductase [Ponticaulis sp.]OUX96446.1 MAG: phosphoadenosine phosphosulfate reductase [Hyphomonadaceae bacterium TMED5]|tara:strand:+ start:52942 stop:53718 length:777 start_codon:yes stop_codon:yes gene_type:complete
MVQEKISAVLAGESTKERVASLNARWRTIQAERVLRLALLEEFPGRIAVSSSFGTESAVLLHLVSRVYKAAPVLFLDTGKHFPETIAYRDELIERLGLRDVRIVRPLENELNDEDPKGDLHKFDFDACCALRKVRPLEYAMDDFDAWITGRKRYQNTDREDLPIFELDTTGKVKVNPLANWTPTDLQTYFSEHDLPRHPLEAKGYRSIGCEPCTSPVAEGEDPRAGRWRESEKTECGIHVTADGKVVRTRLIDTSERV